MGRKRWEGVSKPQRSQILGEISRSRAAELTDEERKAIGERLAKARTRISKESRSELASAAAKARWAKARAAEPVEKPGDKEVTKSRPRRSPSKKSK
jgi:hypothetical protein